VKVRKNSGRKKAKYEKTMQKSRAHVAEDKTCSPDIEIQVQQNDLQVFICPQKSQLTEYNKV